MAQAVQVKHAYITRQKGISGGKPTIKGTRIRVVQIALEYERLGWSPDQVLQAHPQLTLAQVHDALSYYYEHAAELNAELLANEQYVEQLRLTHSRSVLEEKRERH